MIKRVLIIIYFLIVLVFAIASVLTTWSNDLAIILVLEIFVDVVILCGIILSLYDKFVKWWVIPFLICVIGEVVLISIDERVGIRQAIQWALILLPAIYLNLKVMGFMGNRKLLKSDTV